MTTDAMGQPWLVSLWKHVDKAQRMKLLERCQLSFWENEMVIPDSSVKMVLWIVQLLSETCKYENICLLLSEYMYRLDKTNGLGLPKIPVHPIGYDDAESLLR